MKNLKKQINNTIIIAAAGSGKTTELINQINKKVEELPNNKILAVITYTNAATNEIMDRLGGKSTIQSNIFIGTIHSFLIRYLIRPYGKILKLVSEELIINDYEIDVKGLEYPHIVRARLEAQLSSKGVVTYDYIETLAKKILENELVKVQFCNRIKYLFIDEFQDSSRGQFDIFEILRKGKKTEVTMVGDPEQQIMSFKKRSKTTRPHPIYELQKPGVKIYKLKKLTNNYRSSETVVNFINKFHSNIKQSWSNKEIETKNPVIFLTPMQVKNIIKEFNDICENENYAKVKPKTRFFLAYTNNLYGEFRSSSFNHKVKENEPLISTILDFLSAFFNVKKSELDKTLQLDEIELRKNCLQVFYKINREHQHDLEAFMLFLENLFEYKRATNKSKVHFNIQEKFEKLIFTLKVRTSNVDIKNCGKPEEYQDSFLTIHKSKGLQADAVLVVARTENELLKWLETDKTIRLSDKQDTCRLGYVAFSRPRELLCIACLKPISTDTQRLLKELNLTVYPIIEKEDS